MNNPANVLVIEENDSDADNVLIALQKGLPECLPIRLHNCKEAQQLLYDNNRITEEGRNIKLIIANISREGGCTVDFVKKVKSNAYTQTLPVFALISEPGCLNLFSDVVKAGSNLCLVKSNELSDKLRQEAGYYWQLFN